MTEEFKELIRVHHVLILTNIILFVIITFISWDLLWWMNIAGWDPSGRVAFMFMLIAVNGFMIGAFCDWKASK